MRAGDSVLALGNPGRQCALVTEAFQSKGRKRAQGSLPQLHVNDVLVTRSWPGQPAPGREPGCPEMSSGSLEGSECSLHSLVCEIGVGWAGGQ